MIPRATYRLQFHMGFPFAAGADLAPYLADLGISHVYASPILKARAGSLHCYDVVDHACINPELGGEASFRQMCDKLASQGIGVILDIVPNHMAVSDSNNRQWLDVLKHGENSRFAHWFDIDFEPPSASLSGKILLPFLEAPYRQVLTSGKLRVAADDLTERFSVRYHDHVFPIRPEDCAILAKEDLREYDTPQKLHDLLQKQHYRLSWWRTANSFINWRRFFDITELAGLAVEQDDVFDAVHDIPLRLFREGLVDGFRVDHVDGLSDPGAYCRKLRRLLDEARPQAERDGRGYLVVEKILAADEQLRRDWQVEGTTGYDFMNSVSALQHHPGGAGPLAMLWSDISGRSPNFDAEERFARLEISTRNFAAQFRDLACRMAELSMMSAPECDLTAAIFVRALRAIVSELRIYRSYTPDTPDRLWEPAFAQALAKAKAITDIDGKAVEFITRLAGGERDSVIRNDLFRRLHQLTAPVAAKAVEDTAFYRYGRLLSRNDVGSSPAQFSLDPNDFHNLAYQRQKIWPQAMLTTATHDHKRGEDIRARLAVLSELSEEWGENVTEWFSLNRSKRPSKFSQSDEYQLYQMIFGAWPLGLHCRDAQGLALFRDRLKGWQRKSLREAKLQSSWLKPDAALEAAADDFLADLLDPDRSAPFLQVLSSFVARIAPAGVLNSLVQTTLRNTLPGVPDIYQGSECWDFTLVDPDNRRLVDFSVRTRTLQEIPDGDPFASAWGNDRIKQSLIARLLGLRKSVPALFTHGDYQPLMAEGTRHEHIFAFSRHYQRTHLVVIVPIHVGALCGTDTLMLPANWWGDTSVSLPRDMDSFQDILRSDAPAIVGSKIDLADHLAITPLLVLQSSLV